MVGEFEYLLLSAAARLGEEAYGASMRAEIERLTGRQASFGAIYTTLDRLEAKGLVTTALGEATAERGGRAKRLVKLTKAGREAAAEFYRATVVMSAGLPWAVKA
jgi:DNA-binding PadR family transcriptional regulator